MLLAYDAAGKVVATLAYMVAHDAAGEATGLIDFAAHEEAGGKLRDIWDNDRAVGSGTWPEWIGARAHDFRVDLTGKRITALVHKDSGHRRERAVIEAAIEAAPFVDGDHDGPGSHRVQDIRHIVGGPTAPLVLDDQGRTVGRSPQPTGTPPHLPVVGRTVSG